MFLANIGGIFILVAILGLFFWWIIFAVKTPGKKAFGFLFTFVGFALVGFVLNILFRPTDWH